MDERREKTLGELFKKILDSFRQRLNSAQTRKDVFEACVEATKEIVNTLHRPGFEAGDESREHRIEKLRQVITRELTFLGPSLRERNAAICRAAREGDTEAVKGISAEKEKYRESLLRLPSIEDVIQYAAMCDTEAAEALKQAKVWCGVERPGSLCRKPCRHGSRRPRDAGDREPPSGETITLPCSSACSMHGSRSCRANSSC